MRRCTIAGERIVAVGEVPAGAELRDLGNVAILPGLVNAHTHLEFSDLAEPLGLPGEPLPAWIRRVVAGRRARPTGGTSGVAAGLSESIRAGTTTIGEIATGPWPAATGPECTGPDASLAVFRELIGLAPDMVAARLEIARAHLDEPWAAQRHPPGAQPACAYSVHPDLVRGLADLARERGAPLAMHLAESPEELELLATGGGPFRTLLEELQAWAPGAIPLGARVLDYLRVLATAPRAVIVHGNYLAADEIEFLAANADRMSVVYCPRTHARFGHPRYPLAKLLAAGVPIALGTDSRASNPDLSLLTEMRFVARQHPEVASETILSMGTSNGARALGYGDELGTLAVGSRANLAVVPLAEREAADPYELLFDSALPACQTWYRGRSV